MNRTRAVDLAAKCGEGARVLDVGGGASPLARADWVIDALPFPARGALGSASTLASRFTERTWVQRDLCDRTPWPFADGFFDFAVCVHVLEDVRDPLWVCSEMQRVSRAGYIETPSRIVEQSVGVEHPRYAGYYHHRWLVNEEEGRLMFRHKPHSLHSLRGAIVTRVGPFRRIDPKYENLALEWKGSITCLEALEFDEAAVHRELYSFAGRARNLPGLTAPSGLSLAAKLRRAVYFARLRMG